jgi:hypothetical protein
MAFLPRATYNIDVLDGGLNTKNNDLSCPSNMSPLLRDIEFSDAGSINLAKGYSSWLTALGTAQVDCLHAAYFSGTEYLLASQSALVSVATAGAAAWSVVTGSTGVFTAGVDVCMRTVQDEVYMTNGYATAHRYDGSEMFTVGVSAFASGVTGTVTITAAGGSFLPGSYYYGISGQNANGVESNVATFTSLLTVASSGAVILSALPAFYPSSANVSTRYLYRTTAGSQTEFWRVTALTAAQTSFTDTLSDASLADVSLGPTDHNPPPKCRFWWYHRGRMFGSGDPSYPYRVYYSDANQPEIWPTTNYQEIGEGDGQPITGIAVMGNSLVVHKATASGSQQSIWLMYMPDSTDVTGTSNWYVTKSPSAHAAAGWKSIVFFENLMGFVARDGFYAFTGDDIARGPATSQIGQYVAESLSENASAAFEDVTDASAVKIPAVQFDDTIYMGVYLARSFLTSQIHTYDYVTASQQRGVGAWSLLSGPQVLNTMARFGQTVYSGGQTTGVVYRHFDTYSLNASDSTAWYLTPKLAGQKQHWAHTKVWRNLYLTMSNSTIASSTVTFYDFVNNKYGYSTLVAGTGRAYTTVRMPIVDTDGNPMVSTNLQILFNTNGVASFTTSQAAPWQVHRMELEYLLRSRRI